jgi:hypothetical protein
MCSGQKCELLGGCSFCRLLGWLRLLYTYHALLLTRQVQVLANAVLVHHLLLVENEGKCNLMQLSLALKQIVVNYFFNRWSFLWVFFEHLVDELREFRIYSMLDLLAFLVEHLVLKLVFRLRWKGVAVTAHLI